MTDSRLLKARRAVTAVAVSPVAIGAGIGVCCAAAFLELASDVAERDTERLDAAVLLWIAARRSPLLTEFFLGMTALGAWPVLGLLTFGIVVASGLAGRRRPALALAVAMLGVPLLSRILKTIYARARPNLVEHLDKVSSASFPSGHTLGSVVFCSTLALLVYEHIARRSLRLFVVGFSLCIGALVAASRVYLGVHYPTDVMGGALIGVTWALCVVAVERWLARPVRSIRS
jgi:undecaprenyl-diphosphatase